MLYRLCKTTFVRNYKGYGYIYNQLTRSDRLFNKSGGVFLSAISRQPQTVQELVEIIAPQFNDVDKNILMNDLVDFLGQLEDDDFIVEGNTLEELEKHELLFSYDNVKFIVDTKQRLSVLTDSDVAANVSDTQKELTKLAGDNHILYDLQIDLTSACNEHCRHCYIPPDIQPEHADPRFVRRIIDEFANMGGVTLNFSGGECLLHPEFPELLNYARSKDLSVGILSNLICLDDTLAKVLRDALLSMVQVSVYSLNEYEHDYITKVPGSLALTLAAINKLKAYNVPVQISCPVMKSNYKSYKNVLQWANDQSMKAQTDFIMMARSDFTKDNLAERLDDKETIKLITDIIINDSAYNKEILNYQKPPDDPDAPLCGVGRSTLCVASDGSCVPCSGWQGMVVGDLKKNSLLDIWQNSPDLNHLRSLTKNTFPKCLSCEDRHFCSMCLVRNYNESDGDMYCVADRFCQVARINRIVVEEWLAKQ